MKDKAIIYCVGKNTISEQALYLIRSIRLINQNYKIYGFVVKEEQEQIPDQIFEELKNRENRDVYIVIYLKDWHEHRADIVSNEDILGYNSKYNILVKVVEFPNTIIYKTE